MCNLRVIFRNKLNNNKYIYIYITRKKYLQDFTVRFFLPSLAAMPTHNTTAAETLFVKACLEYEFFFPPLLSTTAYDL